MPEISDRGRITEVVRVTARIELPPSDRCRFKTIETTEEFMVEFNNTIIKEGLPKDFKSLAQRFQRAADHARQLSSLSLVR